MARVLAGAFAAQLRDVLSEAARGVGAPLSCVDSLRAVALCAVAAARSGHPELAGTALGFVVAATVRLPPDVLLNALEAAAATGRDTHIETLLSLLSPDLIFVGRIRMVPDRALRRFRAAAPADAEEAIATEINPILDALAHDLSLPDLVVRARATSQLILFCEAVRFMIDLDPDIAVVLRSLCGHLDPFAGVAGTRPSAAGFALAASVSGRARRRTLPPRDAVLSVHERALGLAEEATRSCLHDNAWQHRLQ